MNESVLLIKAPLQNDSMVVVVPAHKVTGRLIGQYGTGFSA